MDDHSRQQDEIQKQIVAAIAHGDVGQALDQIEALGAWHHHDKEPAAIQNLLSCWYARYQNAPENSFMILEHRQSYVRVFNEKIHDVLKSRGDVDINEFFVETAKHGVMRFSAGDAGMFMQNDDGLGVSTGLRGTLVHASQDCFTVRINDQVCHSRVSCHPDESQDPVNNNRYLDSRFRGDDNCVKFDPQIYNNFQHGYAGLIYGTEGQTFDHVFAVHSTSMDAQDFYVACSRHTFSCDYFSSGDRGGVVQSLDPDNNFNSRDPAFRQDDNKRDDDRAKSDYLDDCVAHICDAFYKDHDYYRSHDYTRAPSCGRDDLQKELIR